MRMLLTSSEMEELDYLRALKQRTPAEENKMQQLLRKIMVRNERAARYAKKA